jgi:hypothetical protein
MATIFRCRISGKLIFAPLLIFSSIAYSEYSPEPDNTNQFYMVIGSIKDVKMVSGIMQPHSSPPELIEDKRDGHGGGTRTIKTSPYLCYRMIGFGECKLFSVFNNVATNINTDKQIVIMANFGFDIKPDTKIHLIFTEKYDPPEEFVKTNNLQHCFILKFREGKLDWLDEGTRAFNYELKKYGIMLSKDKKK